MTLPQMSPSKAALRVQMRQRRDALDRRGERSIAICARFGELEWYQRANAIHCYLPIRSEVDTLPLVRQAFLDGKRVAVPVVVPNTPLLAHVWLRADDLQVLVTGAFGTFHPEAGEPCDPAECDLCVAPMLAFDRTCRRLGYGKGHYDRFLAAYPIRTVGVAFAAQEVEALPAESHDVPLSAIITENELVTPTT